MSELRPIILVILTVTLAAIACGFLPGCSYPPLPPPQAQPKLVIPSEIDVCWPEDQQVMITVRHTGCGKDDTIETFSTFVQWWNSDQSCEREETVVDCTRTTERVCPDMFITTTYEPALTDDPKLLILGEGAITHNNGCVSQRKVEIRSVH